MKTILTRRYGFTLIELLVVMAIIGILAGILVPAVQNALVKAAMAQAMANGRSMHQALYMVHMDGDVVYPRSSGEFAFDNSTEYLRWTVTNRVLSVDFSFFAERGLQAAPGLDPETFHAENNAWCVVADLGRSARSVTPLLFTRNLDIRRLDEPLADALTGEQPFGEHGVVVVYLGGHAQVVKRTGLSAMALDENAANVVLRP